MSTLDLLKAIAPKGKKEILEGIAPYLDLHAPKYGLTTKLRLAHFVAQAAHETAGFQTLTEYGKESYFKKYDGRRDLGNVKAGDGPRYRGRGIFQITGRANYKTFGDKIGVDLENNPTDAADYNVAVLTALEYWKDRNLTKHADADDIRRITKRINGGYNGFEDRQLYLARAKKFLGI